MGRPSFLLGKNLPVGPFERLPISLKVTPHLCSVHKSNKLSSSPEQTSMELYLGSLLDFRGKYISPPRKKKLVTSYKTNCFEYYNPNERTDLCICLPLNKINVNFESIGK